MNPRLSNRHRRVLIVDDNEAIHDDFRKVLGPPDAQSEELSAFEAKIFGGGDGDEVSFELDTASQGMEALQMVKAAVAEDRPYSLAFVDVRMPPGWDGIETVAHLWEVCPDLQVVICTAYSDYSWQEMQEKIKPRDRLLILKKPFDSIEVQQIANALTEKWRLQEESKHRMAELDQLVRQRTLELEESRREALSMMEDAVRNRGEEEKAHEKLKQEVADRARLEDQFREQASLLDKARDAILVTDMEHRITYWNKSAELLYGWSHEEAIGAATTGLLQTNAAAFAEAQSAVRETGEWTGELRQFSRQGTELFVESRWTLVLDSDCRPKGILLINTDITERKKLEDHLLRAQRMESIGTLAGGIAHDLNNVLLPIMMSIDLLKLSVQDENALATLSIIETSSRRGAEMVQQVLSFARGVEGQRLLIHPAEVIEDVRRIIQDTFPKNIVVSCEIPADLPSFLGDATQVHQVLLNLCVNARDAMPNGGRLQIEAAVVQVDENYAGMMPNLKAGAYVMMQVLDSGTGIPDEIRERIFDPFFTTKELGKGTGLGLSTVVAIIKSHGGFINVYSELGRGTTFRVYWPTESTGGAASPAAAACTHPRGNGELVLVVDDEEAVRSITRQTLEAFGYRVLTANDGAEAVALYAQHRNSVELVLTDMMMPVMDGPATIEHIQRMNPKAKIVAASGLNSNGCVSRAAAMGVKHFLNKPYTAQTMLATLKLAAAN